MASSLLLPVQSGLGFGNIDACCKRCRKLELFGILTTLDISGDIFATNHHRLHCRLHCHPTTLLLRLASCQPRRYHRHAARQGLSRLATQPSVQFCREASAIINGLATSRCFGSRHDRVSRWWLAMLGAAWQAQAQLRAAAACPLDDSDSEFKNIIADQHTLGQTRPTGRYFADAFACTRVTAPDSTPVVSPCCDCPPGETAKPRSKKVLDTKDSPQLFLQRSKVSDATQELYRSYARSFVLRQGYRLDTPVESVNLKALRTYAPTGGPRCTEAKP